MADKPHELTGKTDEGLLYLTAKGKKRLSPWVTDIDGAVYAFKQAADPQAVSAAMARLSRNANDLRTIIASEFMDDKARELGLLRRVVNQFGDDSVMQLYPVQMVFEGVSNLATKEIEWGRLAAYLEQSTRYLRFDRKDSEGNYAYVVPAELDGETAKVYKQSLDEIFDIYSSLYTQLKAHIMEHTDVPEAEQDAAWRTACHAQACDGVRSLLPAATKATVGVVGSAQAINNMIQHLRAHELPEMHDLGQKALGAVRQVAPVFFERTDLPTRGDLIVNHHRQTRSQTAALASRLLGSLTGATIVQGPYVKLLGVDDSEDGLIAKILADTSTYPYEAIQATVSTLSPKQKQNIINTYVGERYNRRAKPGRAFEFPHYTFEVQCDYGAFRDIQRHRLVDGLEWQPLTIVLGHATPSAVKAVRLEKAYRRAVEVSEELYQTLKDRGYADQAQYATLFGHTMRFTVKMNARSLIHTAELRTSSQGHPSYRRVYQDMYDLVAQVHPAIAKAMRFVSKDEDEKLARLGAERYSQAKFAG